MKDRPGALVQYRIECFDVVQKGVTIHIVPSLGIFSDQSNWLPFHCCTVFLSFRNPPFSSSRRPSNAVFSLSSIIKRIILLTLSTWTTNQLSQSQEQTNRRGKRGRNRSDTRAGHSTLQFLVLLHTPSYHSNWSMLLSLFHRKKAAA